MNKEILFKAKRLDNGEWIEGYYNAKEIVGNAFDNSELLSNPIHTKRF